MNARKVRSFGHLGFGLLICIIAFAGCGDDSINVKSKNGNNTSKPSDESCEAGHVTCGGACCEEQSCCNDSCVDLTKDSKNCGQCGKVCEGEEFCKDSKCVSASEKCPKDFCEGECVDMSSDPRYCGSCTNKCNDDESCESGECVLNCDGGLSRCGDICLDVSADNQNCGSCGNVCQANSYCSEKECKCKSGYFDCDEDQSNGCESELTCESLCKEGEEKCGSECCKVGWTCVEEAGCLNLLEDNFNCGGFGKYCEGNQKCVSGTCTDTEATCTNEEQSCHGNCVNVKTDILNCGGCDIICPADYECEEGDCKAKEDPDACKAPLQDCYGPCVNLMTDDNNCGSCLNKCGEGTKCEEGQCLVQCGDKTRCGTSCVDVNTDSKNCSACGVVCGAGEACKDGVCGCAEGRYDCDQNAANGCESTSACGCTPGATQPCWRGDEANRKKGICKDGTQECDSSGQFWGACEGGVYPSAITCDDKGIYIGGDQNCNGIDDTNEECKSRCDLMAGEMSYIGCEYWPVYLHNYSYANSYYYVVMSNPSSTETAKVYIYNKSTQASNSPITISIKPKEVYRQKLDMNGPTASGITSTAYRVRSSIPITVYQFDPMPTGNQTYSNDASLLLPINTLGKKYMNLAWYGGAPSNAALTVIATEAGKTTVKIKSKAPTISGSSVPAMSAGETKTFTLSQYDVLNIENSSSDMSGSLIESDKKVAVYGGSVCAYVPKGKSYCDHLEEQLFPTQAWGKSYYAVKTWPRSSETEIWRILAQEDGTKVQLLAPINKTVDLKAGEFHELETKESFEIKSNKPILVGQYMVGSQYNAGGTGDPSYLLNVPYEQYRTDYDFLVPPTYHTNYVTVIYPSNTTIYLDGKSASLQNVKSIGSSGFKYGYIAFGSTSASHHIEANNPIGVWGYGFATNVSYGYPIGLDLKVINGQ